MSDHDRTHFAVSHLMDSLGLDLQDPNFVDTPRRVTDMYQELMSGLDRTEERIRQLFETSFPSDYDGIISQFGIEALGVCPHHLMPVTYRIDLGYIPAPGGKVIGLSKLPRMVKILAARPIMQEQLTVDLIDYLHHYLAPSGIIAVVYGEHSCMRLRGVKDHSTTVTSRVSGVFADDPYAKPEFFQLANRGVR